MVPIVSGWLVAMLAPCGIVGFNKGSGASRRGGRKLIIIRVSLA